MQKQIRRQNKIRDSRMPVFLGINAAYHESAVAFVQGGQVLFALEEERINRIKHGKVALSNNPDQLPWKALSVALEAMNLTMEHIATVAYSLVPDKRLNSLGLDPEPLDLEAGFGNLENELDFNERMLSVKNQFKKPFHFIPHHLAHAASAFYLSPFEEAACLVVDGIGEDSTAWMGYSTKGQLELLEAIPYPHSIGLLWERIAVFLGFSVYDSSKIMALAAHGDPRRFTKEMEKLLIVPDPEGGRLGSNTPPFLVDLNIARFRSPDVKGLESLFGPKRVFPEPIDQDRFVDIAAALQKQTETALLATTRRLHRATHLPYLCYSGGVALNCIANARIEKEGYFEGIYIPGAAHDAGTAIGAAIIAENRYNGKPIARSLRPHSHFMGPLFSAAEIDASIDNIGIEVTIIKDPAAMAADMIADYKLVGWFQGSLEFGPRALGHRSILGNPCKTMTSESINAFIKHRESFRPFGASVLAEYAEEWFEIPDIRPGAKFSRNLMLFAYSVKKNLAGLIPAVLNLDGTCRIQTIDADSDPLFYLLIRNVFKRTGVPLVLNTSFNDSEPIVCSPREAINTFLKSGLDALFINNRLITRIDKL